MFQKVTTVVLIGTALLVGAFVLICAAMVERPELRRGFRLIRIDLLGHGGS